MSMPELRGCRVECSNAIARLRMVAPIAFKASGRWDVLLVNPLRPTDPKLEGNFEITFDR